LIKLPVNIENITLYLPYNLGGIEMSKSANNVLSSFCYFSVFFMPFLFPLIVWILASGDTSKHAGKALLYHILPIFSMLISAVFFAGFSANHSNTTFIIGFIIALLGIYYVIKNLVLGIKLLFA